MLLVKTWKIVVYVPGWHCRHTALLLLLFVYIGHRRFDFCTVSAEANNSAHNNRG